LLASSVDRTVVTTAEVIEAEIGVIGEAIEVATGTVEMGTVAGTEGESAGKDLVVLAVDHPLSSEAGRRAGSIQPICCGGWMRTIMG
jgi:hypothetical protein